jgi:lipoprotein-anchoring transpeptidase ErfK/SrfK
MTRDHSHAARRALTALVAVVALGALSSSALAANPLTVTPTQELVSFTKSQEAHTKPSASAPDVGKVSGTTPITDESTVLPVMGIYKQWLLVRLPGRPAGRTGWIDQNTTTTRSVTPWHVVVDTATRKIAIYRSGHKVRVFPVVVGKASTPTPPGEFFVEERVSLGPSEVGAPYALALSARSNVLQDFDGGPGQIAIHGLENVGGVPGTAVSHGCLRLDTAALKWVVAHIGPGVPVTIQ